MKCSPVLRVLVGICLVALQTVTHSSWRTRYVPPVLSEDVPTNKAPPPPPGTNVLLVSVPRAYELDGARGRYCSPEVSVYNASGYLLKDLVLRVDFFQRTSPDKSVFVGSTVTRVHQLLPRAERRESFFVLDAGNCVGLHGMARVQHCKAAGDIECAPFVAFTDSGRVPLQPAPPGDGDRLLYAPAPGASTPATAPAGR